MKTEQTVHLLEALIGIAAALAAPRLPAVRDGLLLLIPVVFVVNHYMGRWSPRRSQAEVRALLAWVTEHRLELAIGGLAVVTHALLHSWLTLNVAALIAFIGAHLSYVVWLRLGTAVPPPPTAAIPAD